MRSYIWLRKTRLVDHEEILTTWVVEKRIPTALRGRYSGRAKGVACEQCHAQPLEIQGEFVCVSPKCDACHRTVSCGRMAKNERLDRQRGERVRELFARARRYRAMLDSGEARSLRELGRAEGISGARVCQILQVIDLAPEIVERVDVGIEDIPSGISVTRLREIVACRDRSEQLRRFGELVGE